jgi:4-diphosphocytidyl-2-C-methyl-D-erythritol kinase
MAGRNNRIQQMMSTTAVDRSVGLAAASTHATAKINLTLDVLGRRSDGFHDVRSVVIGVGLSDQIRCEQTQRSGIQVECNDAAIDDAGNLARLAASLLAAELGRSPSLRLQIEKSIPVGGGMGGGSSDAAATLRLCNRLWGAGLNDARLAELGSSLGSDVPLFYYLPAALMEGRGERVTALSIAWKGWALLVSTGTEVSTAEVYKTHRLDFERTEQQDAAEQVAAISSATSAEQLMPMTRNDLEPAVFRVAAEVERVSKALHHRGLGPFRVSGAGSTLYRLFDQEEDANRVAEEVTRAGIGEWTKVVAAPVGQQPIVTEES